MSAREVARSVERPLPSWVAFQQSVSSHGMAWDPRWMGGLLDIRVTIEGAWFERVMRDVERRRGPSALKVAP